MSEPPCEKKDEPGSPCSQPPTDTISQIMDIYNKVDSEELPIDEAADKITEVLKAQREKKLECLKKLGQKIG